MKKTEKKGRKGSKGKVVVKDLELGKVKGGIETEDPKGGAGYDAFLKVDGQFHKADLGRGAVFPKVEYKIGR